MAAIELDSVEEQRALTPLIERQAQAQIGRIRVIVRGDWPVDDLVKNLSGPAFFDWIAERVERVLHEGGMADGADRPVGLTWSFPIE